ncbi:hypothetical protein QQ045_016322 [Rhodiola kirilowii]
MEDINIIGKGANSLFQDLFGDFPSHGDIKVEEFISPTISDAHNEGLYRLLVEDEIQQVVFTINSKSASGPNGFIGKLFSSCWDIIKVGMLLPFRGSKAVLGRVISPEQTGFVEGRSIHESIGVAHDLLRDINHKTFGGNIMLKLDMSEAYDRLSWQFLLCM